MTKSVLCIMMVIFILVSSRAMAGCKGKTIDIHNDSRYSPIQYIIQSDIFSGTTSGTISSGKHKEAGTLTGNGKFTVQVTYEALSCKLEAEAYKKLGHCDLKNKKINCSPDWRLVPSSNILHSDIDIYIRTGNIAS